MSELGENAAIAARAREELAYAEEQLRGYEIEHDSDWSPEIRAGLREMVAVLRRVVNGQQKVALLQRRIEHSDGSSHGCTHWHFRLADAETEVSWETPLSANVAYRFRVIDANDGVLFTGSPDWSLSRAQFEVTEWCRKNGWIVEVAP